jgi:hypothetical protein
MKIVKHEIEEINSKPSTAMSKSIKSAHSIKQAVFGPSQEAAMRRWLVAAVLLTTIVGSVAGLVVSNSSRSTSVVGSPNGVMPEVVAVAEGPRLVMPTVYVSASRDVAAADGGEVSVN